MRREVDGDRLAGGDPDLLLDLRRVPVLRHRIGREPLARLGEERVLLQTAPGAGDARFGVDDDVADIDQPGLRDRHERQQRRRRIAAGTGDKPRAPYLVAIELRQPVDRFLLQRRRTVLMAVPFGVDRHVGEAKIRRHVDHLHLRVCGEHRGSDLLRGAVRQPAEDGVELRPVDLLPFDEGRQVEHEEMRKDLRHRLAGMGVGGERRDLHVRMARGEAYQVGAGIAGRAENADPDPVHRLGSAGETRLRSSGLPARSKRQVGRAGRRRRG